MAKRIYNEIDEMFEKLELVNSILASSDVTILENVDKALSLQCEIINRLEHFIIRRFSRLEESINGENE